MTMYISDSFRGGGTSSGGGGGTGFASNNYDLGNDFTIHALSRDADGMLNYTKIRSIDDDVVYHDDKHLCYNNDHKIRSKKNFKSKKSKLRNIVTNEHLSEDMEELTHHMIEKGPLTVWADKDIECFYVEDILKEYKVLQYFRSIHCQLEKET